MNKRSFIIFAAAGFFGTIFLVVFLMRISIVNTEIELRASVVAKQKQCEAYFDKMWKILQQEAGVADQYKQAFKEIYPALIEGRYKQGDGTFMKWITESNPNFDIRLYDKLMQDISIQREGYFNEQSSLIDRQREHATYLIKTPNSWFLSSSLKPVDIIIVTSSTTKEAYKTGEENEVDLFKKDTSK